MSKIIRKYGVSFKVEKEILASGTERLVIYRLDRFWSRWLFRVEEYLRDWEYQCVAADEQDASRIINIAFNTRKHGYVVKTEKVKIDINENI